jgi:hypothetical protein
MNNGRRDVESRHIVPGDRPDGKETPRQISGIA